MNDDGETRRVGFELEFSGVNLEQTLKALSDVYPCKLLSRTDAEAKVELGDIGQFNIEIDWAYLKDKASEKGSKPTEEDWITLLSQAATFLVPMEVVCPPIPVNKLDMLLPLVSSLKKAGAIGTDESLIAAYGVHINTEIPKLDAASLSAYIRAFCLLQWWLVDERGVNLARRLSPYIDLYPENYIKQVLSYSDASMEQIFSDYLQFNPTRNRALDLLPLLASIDETKVRSVVDDPRIKPRPAFHYRLPDCKIEQDNWSLSDAWDTWLVVETLASNEDDLITLGKEFLSSDRPILDVSRSQWVERIKQWIDEQELA
ncbi:MAG: amidoligase family protein [Pseudohongiellaceae bacterium]|nr:amidoligase family protein [Pseudohongiellaceae bacterium]